MFTITLNSFVKQFNRKLKRFPLQEYDAQFMKLIECNDGTFRLKFLIWHPKGNNGKGDTETYATYNKYKKEFIQKEFFKGRSAESMRNSQWRIKLVKNPYNDDRTIASFKPHKWTYPKSWVVYHENWQMCGNDETPSPEKQRYLDERRKTDKKFDITCRLRELWARALAGGLSDDKMVEWFGINYDGLISHLKSTIKDPEIKWENRKSFHIDHTQPITSFDLLTKDGIKAAMHYTNTRCISPKENREKYCNTSTITTNLSFLEEVLS